MTIKTWEDRSAEAGAIGQSLPYYMQGEIDDLRAELAEKSTAYMDGFEAGKDESRDAYAELRAELAALAGYCETLNAALSELRTDYAIYRTGAKVQHDELRVELAEYTSIGYLEKHHTDGSRDIRLCNLVKENAWKNLVQVFIRGKQNDDATAS